MAVARLRLLLPVVAALLLLGSGCTSIGMGNFGNDTEEARVAREELLRQTPLGSLRANVVSMLRENYYLMEPRTGKPFPQLGSEYLYAHRWHRVSSHSYRIWELGLRFEDDKLVEVVAESKLRD